MAKRKGPSTSSRPRARDKAAKEERDGREVENTQRLDKLPPEMWEKILDDLESDDLFPLALSCRYFRQKQKELLARTRQSVPESGKPRLALKTTLRGPYSYMPHRGEPPSSEYLRFCRKEKGAGHYGNCKVWCIRCLAAFHGHLPLLQELQAGLKRLDSGITRAAARGGQMETLQWLKTREGFKMDTWLFAFACEGGHWEIIRWLRSEDCPWNVDACTGAAKGGHLEILKWLRSEGCPWIECTCSGAAEGGHLEILKWLRSEGCPWNEGACQNAALGGHLDVLRWAIDNGCPYWVNDWWPKPARDLVEYLQRA